MKSALRLVLAVLAVAAQIAMPVAVYATPTHAGPPLDICTTAGDVRDALPVRGRAPLPATDPHHCAQSPCCAGTVTPVFAPPRVPAAVVPVDTHDERVVAVPLRPQAAPERCAAGPRGPPSSG